MDLNPSFTAEEAAEALEFSMGRATVDPDCSPTLTELGSWDGWLDLDAEGSTEGLFFTAVHQAYKALSGVFNRLGMSAEDQEEAVSLGLLHLSFTPPYGRMTLQSGMLAHVALQAQWGEDRVLDFEEALPIIDRERLDGERPFLAGLEAILGLAQTLAGVYLEVEAGNGERE